MSRLVNVLNGFDPRVQVRISESDGIANIIVLQREIYGDNPEILREKVREEMATRGYDSCTINEWVMHID
jgi:hypothetical protein